jgi:hypothetical protein
MPKKTKKKKKVENKYSWTTIVYFTIVCFGFFFILGYLVYIGEKQSFEFEKQMEKSCEKQGWELVNSYKFSGARCREIKEGFVIYHELEIINHTLYLVQPSATYNIVINYQEGVERGYEQGDGEILIPLMDYANK